MSWSNGQSDVERRSRRGLVVVDWSEPLVPNHVWYSFYKLRKNEKLSEPHPIQDPNPGPVVWQHNALINLP